AAPPVAARAGPLGHARAHRLRADGGGQGAPPGRAGLLRAGRVGGRELRRPVRVLRADGRRDPHPHPRGPAHPAHGEAGGGQGVRASPPRAARRVHARAATSRTRAGRARGALARRSHHHRARPELRALPGRRARTDQQHPASCRTIRAGARRREASRGPWNNEHQGARMTSIRVAIVGVGNCASSLVQGVHFYRDADPSSTVPGLMHVQFGDYHVSSLEFVAAFDVDAKKVGFDLSEAINASENNTIKIADVPPLGVTVQRGPTLDGVGKYYAQTIEESDAEPVDVVAALRGAQVDVVVCSLPVGSEEAATFYAQPPTDAGVAFVSALPVFIASDPEWAAKFEQAGVPIVGDDIKSQVGATITHRVLAKLFEDRGVQLDRTMQLNVGGNMDFKNMKELDRLESKKISKTQAVTSQIDRDLGKGNVHVGPSDHVQWLEDRKWAYVRLEGRAFGDVPLNLEYKLE